MPDVQIDTSNLSIPAITVIGTGTGLVHGANSPSATLALPVGEGYRLQQESMPAADLTFDIKADGTVDFDPRFDAFLGGRGESRLVVQGLPVCIDLAALAVDLVMTGPVGAPVLGHGGVHRLSLLPGRCALNLHAPASGGLGFVVATDGTVTPDAVSRDLLEVDGTSLVVRGHQISIDGRALSHDLILVGSSQGLPRTRVNEVTLVPGSGYVFQAGHAAVGNWSFGVNAEGSVTLDAALTGFAMARGRTLTIRGYPINIDARALSHDLVPLPPQAPLLPRTRVNQLTLMPATAYLLQGNVGAIASWTYQVTVDGNVKLDPDFSFATALGNTLTITGHRITIDGRALSHDLLLLPVGLPFLSRAETHAVTLMPADYMFQAGNAAVANWTFGVGKDGNVTLDPTLASFATASGSSLIIRGHTISIDGRALSHDLIPLPPSEPVLSHAQINQLTLMPATAYLMRAGSVIGDFSYDVTVAGPIRYSESYDEFLVGRGTTTLAVSGCALVVDASRADSDLLGIQTAGLVAQEPRRLAATLMPGSSYVPQTSNGVFRTGFTITVGGGVTFDPSVAGSYVVRPPSQPNPSRVGEEVIFSLRVVPGPGARPSGVPQGRVTISEAGVFLGGGQLDADGAATVRTSSLTAGAHHIAASYAGDPSFLPSSAVIRHRVT